MLRRSRPTGLLAWITVFAIGAAFAGCDDSGGRKRIPPPPPQLPDPACEVDADCVHSCETLGDCCYSPCGCATPVHQDRVSAIADYNRRACAGTKLDCPTRGICPTPTAEPPVCVEGRCVSRRPTTGTKSPPNTDPPTAP